MEVITHQLLALFINQNLLFMLNIMYLKKQGRKIKYDFYRQKNPSDARVTATQINPRTVVRRIIELDSSTSGYQRSFPLKLIVTVWNSLSGRVDLLC